MLDRLVGADRATEGEALLGVGDRGLERGLHGAERLGGDQRLRQEPGGAQRVLVDVEHLAGRAVQAHVAEHAGEVVAADLLDGPAAGAGVHDSTPNRDLYHGTDLPGREEPRGRARISAAEASRPTVPDHTANGMFATRLGPW